MPEREDDHAKRRAAAAGPGTADGAEAGHAGQPGAGHASGQPGGGHAAGTPTGGHPGQPGGGHAAQPMAHPGGGHTAAQPSTAPPTAQPSGGHAAGQPGTTQPSGGHAAGQPSGTRPMTQPQAGQAGPPAAPPGTSSPAQLGGGQPGATSWISIKGILIAAAAIVAIIVAIVAAFFLLRPDPPQQNATQQSPPPAANPPPGAAPTGAAPAGPWFRGTYNYVNTVVSGTITVTSDCPACDATVSSEGRSAVYQWTGTGWTFDAGCKTQTFTPTAVTNGIVQELSTLDSGGCGGGGSTGTATRVGD